MSTLPSLMADLESKGSVQARKLYARHGMDPSRIFGVSVANLKGIAKTIKGQQALACQLYATGNMDAMYLAGMVADGAKLTKAELNQWAEAAVGHQMIAEYTVPWMTVEHPDGRELALAWMKSKKENVAAAGWTSYSGLVSLQPDDALDLAEIEELLQTVIKEIEAAPNRVRYTMNGFVIAVGCYVKPLSKKAKAAARQIGAISVDMGETACKVPLAVESIEKFEAAGKLGRKKKTIRC